MQNRREGRRERERERERERKKERVRERFIGENAYKLLKVLKLLQVVFFGVNGFVVWKGGLVLWG